MKKEILFDFVVDKESKTIKVKRSFHAALPLVWQAWTTAEILDQWWAPHPWKAETQRMDFREGGRWFYAMVSPDGKERHWCLMNYQTIVPEKYFTSVDAFAKDESGEINRHMVVLNDVTAQVLARIKVQESETRLPPGRAAEAWVTPTATMIVATRAITGLGIRSSIRNVS